LLDAEARPPSLRSGMAGKLGRPLALGWRGCLGDAFRKILLGAVSGQDAQPSRSFVPAGRSPGCCVGDGSGRNAGCGIIRIGWLLRDESALPDAVSQAERRRRQLS